MGRALPMLATWTCQRSGDCCEQPAEVVMTHAERAEIERAATTGVVLRFARHADARFVRLLAHPCPLLARDERGRAVCTVYAVRPYACRRFACGRCDVTTERFEHVQVPARARTDRAFRRQLVVMQRRAQPWARAHEWPA